MPDAKPANAIGNIRKSVRPGMRPPMKSPGPVSPGFPTKSPRSTGPYTQGKFLSGGRKATPTGRPVSLQNAAARRLGGGR